jgi:hypothetical protein
MFFMGLVAHPKTMKNKASLRNERKEKPETAE